MDELYELIGAWPAIIAGLVLLFIGGDTLVRGSVGVARSFGISELIIGLTLVGFGTSVPELVTSLRAIDNEAAGLAVGNVVGSNIANILLVLGAAAVIRPIITNPRALSRDSAFMILATIALAAVIYLDQFTRITGVVFAAILVAYMAFSIVADQRTRNVSASAGVEAAPAPTPELELDGPADPLGLAIVFAALGIAAVILGANLLVRGGIDAAETLGVSEAVIGLTIVAIGTSLPELATSGMAALRGRSDVALGNIIGSNIFNILAVLGITAIVHPFSVFTREAGGVETAGDVLGRDEVVVNVMTWTDMGALFLSVFLLVLFAFTGRKLARWEGVVLLGSYALYLALRIGVAPTPFN